MTEKEILEKLKQSAEAVMIPESLAPDKILEKCRNLEQEKTAKGESGEKSSCLEIRSWQGDLRQRRFL